MPCPADVKKARSLSSGSSGAEDDKVIVSVHSFFQQLIRICKKDNSLEKISNTFGRKKLAQVTKETILDNIPSYLEDVFTQEKYFYVKNYSNDLL